MAPTNGTRGRLSGKVALVTGAARGQGAAEAELFCREGARVVLADLRDAEGEERAEALRSAGHDAIFRHLDVSTAGDWDLAIGDAESTFGPLDVLVNNAGVVSFAGIADCSAEEWDEVIAVNQTGVFNGMRAAAPGMRGAGAGSIVNVSSIFAVNAVPGYLAYQASKAAVLQMTRAAAVDLAPEGIRVNCFSPGSSSPR